MDATNPPDSVLKWLEQDRYYRWCTYLFIPIQYAGLVFACWLWSSGDLSTLDSIGLALTMGVVGGIAINTAHELGHKRAELGEVAEPGRAGPDRLRPLLHRAQPRPPRPRRHPRGPGQLAAGGELLGLPAAHRRRQPHARPGGSRPPASTASASRTGALHNDILSAWAMTVVLFAVLAIVFGPVVLPYLLIQAVLGFSLLEVVNYLEHYGLLRQKREDGRYERCLPEHSWNSNNVASNVLLYHLQRHSDHHANPTRRYQALRHVDEAPQLPTGYAGMIVLAWFPPLWRRVMDPRLLDHYDGDVTPRQHPAAQARRRSSPATGRRAA